jgi:hypothetical protein
MRKMIKFNYFRCLSLYALFSLFLFQISFDYGCKPAPRKLVKYSVRYIKPLKEFGFYSERGDSLDFESLLARVEGEMKNLLLEVRKFVKSFGNDIIEEVRPHRVVYAKSLTFRTFLDLKPEIHYLTISIKNGRTQPVITRTIKNVQEFKSLRSEIKEAYETIK